MSIADKLITIANNIEAVYGTGLNKGYVNGEAYGRDIGFTEGYAIGKSDGKEEEYNMFWDIFQKNGEPMAYTYAFANERFTDVNYNPKYDIVCRDSATSDAQQIFYRTLVTDTKVPIKIGKGRAVTQTFSNSVGLITIRKLIVDEACSFPSTFNGCTSLENITIEGTIGKDFDIHYSPLTKDSIISIINALSETSTGTTVTFKKLVVNKVFETSSGANDGSTSIEWTTLIEPYSNWTISLV